ncbi:TetR/AcrR family transcriptional regulator [Subtercola frigoramans]|uniref:AcrR family transcriptional regulator n=1 Tax=Subtercola frigoramans TaxID=120298 RepID=A0ABS2L296_9MICO|nr:TetR/AcrR family transcriptional regulator [Subtercola frigoramans]MBM7471208.1 AcrR family transcriptional regulator [Subtercola frigoramans]
MTEHVDGVSATRGPYRAGRARRQEIIRAATEVFAREGYRGGSLRDVARSLEVTPGAILHHFGSKEQLLVAVLADRDEHSRTAAARYFESHDTAGSLRAIVADNASRPGLMRLFTTLAAEAVSPDHPAHDFFTERYLRLTGFIAEGLDRENFHAPDGASNRDVAALVLATMDGLQLQWLMRPQFSMTGAFDVMLTAHGLLPCRMREPEQAPAMGEAR